MSCGLLLKSWKYWICQTAGQKYLSENKWIKGSVLITDSTFNHSSEKPAILLQSLHHTVTFGTITVSEIRTKWLRADTTSITVVHKRVLILWLFNDAVSTSEVRWSIRIQKEVITVILRTILTFTWKDWRKPHSTSDSLAKIWIRHLQNTNPMHYRYTNLFSMGSLEMYVLIDNINMDHWVCGSGVGLSGSGQELVTGSCEYSNEPLVSINDKEFLEELSTCQLLKKNSAPRVP